MRFLFYRGDLRVGLQTRSDQIDGRDGDRTGRYLHAVAPHPGVAVGHGLRTVTAAVTGGRRDGGLASRRLADTEKTTTPMRLYTGQRLSSGAPGRCVYYVTA